MSCARAPKPTRHPAGLGLKFPGVRRREPPERAPIAKGGGTHGRAHADEAFPSLGARRSALSVGLVERARALVGHACRRARLEVRKIARAFAQQGARAFSMIRRPPSRRFGGLLQQVCKDQFFSLWVKEGRH